MGGFLKLNACSVHYISVIGFQNECLNGRFIMNGKVSMQGFRPYWKRVVEGSQTATVVSPDGTFMYWQLEHRRWAMFSHGTTEGDLPQAVGDFYTRIERGEAPCLAYQSAANMTSWLEGVPQSEQRPDNRAV